MFLFFENEILMSQNVFEVLCLGVSYITILRHGFNTDIMFVMFIEFNSIKCSVAKSDIISVLCIFVKK